MEIVNNISSAIFVIVRMISLALTVMTFHLGFAHQPEVDWNTSKTRIFALCVVSLVQVIKFKITTETPSGVIGYDSILKKKMVRHDVGVRHRNPNSNIKIYQMWLFLGNRVKKWREHKRTKRD